MKQRIKLRAARLAAPLAVAASLLGFGAAQAQTFSKADIAIETQGEEAGGLTCSWQETGVGSYAQVSYSCEAGAVGVLEACIYKNKLVGNSPTQLSVFKDVTGEGGEHGEGVTFIANNSGRINGSITTAVPESHGGEGELCTEPAAAVVVAVRWCNASLTDTTYNLVGANVTELYQEFVKGPVALPGAVPSCAELLASP